MEEDNFLNKNIREDIEYFQHSYYISVESLREIVILQSRNKIKLDYNLDKIITFLNKTQICILSTDLNSIKELEKLPILEIHGKTHEDPFDRMLIAQSIAEKYTIISSDKKFPYYNKCGLKLLVNEI
jgi:PIN domain nuclease of toxin-antitoxin system